MDYMTKLIALALVVQAIAQVASTFSNLKINKALMDHMKGNGDSTS